MNVKVFPEPPIAGRDPDDDRREVEVDRTGRIKVESPGIEQALREILKKLCQIELLLADGLNRDTVDTL